MKTNTAPRNVSIAAAESSTFSISNNAKIFRILIDGLYADKIQSITREIWSNALDAHVQAGRADRPFAVSFPNPFDPTFRVRDYGVSLTHEQVMHMYTDLGHSTKEDTNDAIGKFGIGSKSPFAYTDNFTVTVYLDGTVRFYSAMIGSDGVPAIHLMGEQATTEENGVEVAFPVDASDARAFQNAAKRVSHGFDVKPVVTNVPEFNEWPVLPVLLEGEGWKLLRGKVEGYSEKAYARMGPVLYPINAEALGDLTAMQREILGKTFVIDFPMGALEITASREELSYGRNDPTARSILAKINEIVDGLTQKCLEDFAACETYFEACMLYREQTSSPQIPETVRKIVRESALWRGRLLTNQIEYSPNYAWDGVIFPKSKLSNAVYRFSPAQSMSISAKEGTLLVVEDLTDGKTVKRAATRLKQYIEARGRPEQMVWIRVYTTRDQQRAQQLINFFGDMDGAETIMLDELPMPPKATYSNGSTRRPVQARIYRHGFEDRVELDDEDFEDGGIYVPLDRMEPVVPNGCREPSYIINLLKALGALSQPVYGAPKSMWKKFEGDQWTSLYDFAREWLDEADTDVAADQARLDAVAKVKRNSEIQFLDEYCSLDATDDNSVSRMAVDLLRQAQADTTPSPMRIRDLAYALGTPLELGEDTRDEMEDELELIVEELHTVYPMLGMLADSNVTFHDKVVDRVTEYVIMCDISTKTNQPQASLAA